MWNRAVDTLTVYHISKQIVVVANLCKRIFVLHSREKFPWQGSDGELQHWRARSLENFSSLFRFCNPTQAPIPLPRHILLATHSRHPPPQHLPLGILCRHPPGTLPLPARPLPLAVSFRTRPPAAGATVSVCGARNL